ncbi:MAG: ATP synthase F1 subunit gamma [Mycoplasma sp.]
MASNSLEIKRRISSIKSINKITRAMELVSTAKLQKLKRELDSKKNYFSFSFDTIQKIFSQVKINEVRGLNKKLFLPENDKKIFIIVSSNLGFCGGYNNNLFKKLLKVINKDKDIVVPIGKKAKMFCKNNDIKIIENINLKVDAISFSEIRVIAVNILSLIYKGEYGQVHCCYTKFINSILYEPTIVQILPIDQETLKKDIKNNQKEGTIFEFEPDVGLILQKMVPIYLNSSIYGFVKESEVSEQASRRQSMESATDNANKIKEKLELEYNRARQAKITTEISEIVGGAEAL